MLSTAKHLASQFEAGSFAALRMTYDGIFGFASCLRVFVVEPNS